MAVCAGDRGDAEEAAADGGAGDTATRRHRRRVPW
jgi:hypothetical protein